MIELLSAVLEHYSEYCNVNSYFRESSSREKLSLVCGGIGKYCWIFLCL